jgi:hypothetical protein
MKRSWRILFVLLAVALVAAACGDDDDAGSGAATATSLAPEDVQAPAAAVAAGLQRIDGIVQQAAAAVGTDDATARSLSDQVEPIWFTIEGTVKANDTEVYLGFEDSFASLAGAAEKGDVDRATKAASAVQQAVADYVAKHPA